MPVQYHTVRFENDDSGLAEKNAYTARMARDGWRISSEAIEGGHMKGEEACCGALICLPFAFLAGRTPGFIVVTYAREYSDSVPLTQVFCVKCGASIPSAAKFCPKCGGAQKELASRPKQLLP
jgi:ribosomal protein L40E